MKKIFVAATLIILMALAVPVQAKIIGAPPASADTIAIDTSGFDGNLTGITTLQAALDAYDDETFITSANIDDTAFGDGSAWNGVTTKAPSQNAVRDMMYLYDIDGDGDIDNVDGAVGGGDITGVGPGGLAAGDALTDGYVTTGTVMFIWEGTTDDDNEMSFIVPEDPGADIVITYPTASATLSGLGLAEEFSGVKTFSALPVFSAGVDINEDVDIDFDAADEEVSIVNSAEYGADGAQVTIQNTDADVGAAMYLLRLIYTDDGQANAKFAVFEDNNGDDQFSFNASGAMVAAGSGTFASLLIADAGTIGSASDTDSIAIAANGVVTFSQNIIIPDAGNIGSASDTDAIAIAADGKVTLSQDLIMTGNIELNHATENTLTASGGVLSIEGAALATVASPGLTGDPTITDATPTLILQDSDDAAGTAALYANSSGGANDIVFTIGVEDSGGNSQGYIELDGVNETVDVLKPATFAGTVGITGVLTATAAGANITMADGQLIDASGVTPSDDADEGIIIPTWADVTPTTDAPFITYDPDSNAIKVYEGGWVSISGGSGAPVDAKYIVWDALNGTLSGEMLLAGGTGVDLTGSGPGYAANGTLTISFDATELDDLTWGDGTTATWTYNASAGTDPTIAWGDGTITLSQMTSSSVDINGGAIDGAIIGANSAAAGTFTGVTVGTGGHITVGVVQWDDGSDQIDGEQIADDTIDTDSIDYTSITLNSFTFDVGSVSKTEFGYLDGVTSAIQAQLDGKEGTLTNEAGLYSALSDVSDFLQPGSNETITGNYTFQGNVTIGNGDTDTLTIRSLIIGGNSRAVWIAGSAPSPSYASDTDDLYVGDDIEAGGIIYATQFVSTGSGDSYIGLDQNSGGIVLGANTIGFDADVLKYAASGAVEKTFMNLEDNQTVTGTNTFQSVQYFGDATHAGSFRIYDGSSNYVTVAVAAQTGDWTLTIPDGGSLNQYLYDTDGNGTLGWGTPTASANTDGGAGGIQLNIGGALDADTSFTYTEGTGVLLIGKDTLDGSIKLYNDLAGGDGSATIAVNASQSASSDITVTLPTATGTLAILGANTFTAAQTFSTNIAFSDGATIDQSANNLLEFTENSDYLRFSFDATDLGILWSDGALNLENLEDGVNAIVNIKGKDAGERGELRVLSDGDDKYIQIYNDDTDSVITTSAGGVNIVPAAGSDVLIDGAVSIDAGVVTGITSISSPLYDVSGAAGITFGSADLTAFTFSGQSETLILTPSSDTWTASTDSGVTELNFSALNMVTTGKILGGINIVSKSGASYTLGTDDSDEVNGSWTSNDNGDSTAFALTLPALSGGESGCLAQGDGSDGALTLDNTADYFITDGVKAGAGESITSAGAVDEQICWLAIADGIIKITSKVGTWTPE